MAKLTLTDLASLANQTSAITTINNNNTAIETALENTLSRDGTSPNTMAANLDMNSNRVLNLPEPLNSAEAATKAYVDDQALTLGTGNVVGPASAVLDAVPLFSDTTGKLIKKATLTGLLKLTSGVASAATEGTDYWKPGGTDVAVADGGTGASTASQARTNLGLAVGTDVQAFSTNLANWSTIAPLTSTTAGRLIRFSDAAGTLAQTLISCDGSGNITNVVGITMSGALSGASSIASTGAITSTGGGVGYATGAGGTVTQATSKATGVTLNKLSGQITCNSASLAAATIVSFALTNSFIAATDVLILNHVSGGTPGSYTLNAQCGSGTATINIRNNTAGPLAEAIVISFVVIKGVTA